MKKLILIFVLGILFNSLSAQEFRVNAYGGYIFKDQFNSYFSPSSYYNGIIQDGFRWGLGVEYVIPRKGGLELQYLRQDTNAPTIYQSGNIMNGDLQSTDFDLGFNWIMLNGTRYIPVNEKVEPFAGLGIGMGIFSIKNPDNNTQRTSTKLAWNVRAGSNFWVSSNVAIRLQASLFSAVESVGGGFYFGTGGTGAGLSTYSTMYQFGLEGGLVFRIP
ncbi:outer membrane protein [Algoriphagus formosus]|uniref:Porin family protein n=1 Tax=Algoriphagus formosus TaxID=2007308 RepID=A0A4R5UTL8_9BACT|nr:outer membrane beta-barrel protein [Algoriphagus aquimaris]TDK42510.1 porin family protein [Algoriphagus aquimaris]